MRVWWCESRVEMAQQPQAPSKSTCPQCWWVNGAHFNPNGMMGHRAGELAPEQGGSRGAAAEQAVGAAGLAQHPGAARGLSSAGGCRVLPMGASWHQQRVSLGAAACAALIGCVPVLRQGKGSRRPTVTL